MSNYGLRILYSIVNRLENAVCERCYAPWPDFGTALKERGPAFVRAGVEAAGRGVRHPRRLAPERARLHQPALPARPVPNPPAPYRARPAPASRRGRAVHGQPAADGRLRGRVRDRRRRGPGARHQQRVRGLGPARPGRTALAPRQASPACTCPASRPAR